MASGVILASSIMFPRILLEIAVVNSNLLPLVIVPVSFMFLICLITTWKLWRSLKLQDEKTDQLKLKNPFEIMSALKFGLILMVVMYLSQVIESTVGDKGIYLLSFISGVVDVDAITLSLSHMSLNGLSSNMAAQGIIIAAITNTIFKFGFFMIVAKTKKLLFTGLTMIVAGFLGLYLTSLYLH